jgi:hypothetical protein
MSDKFPHMARPGLNGFPVKQVPSPEPDQADSELPDLGGPYQAHARPSTKPVYTLHCCLGKDGYRSFGYVHLDSDSTFKVDQGGHVITIRFDGTKTTQITITGRNLWRVYDLVHQHRMSWIMRADRDMAADKETIILGIEIVEVEE